MSQTEQLLRRMTGSITAYMDEVGQRPLRLSDYDRAVLAIRDGEFDAFCSLYPKVPDQADDLLIEAAGRPGRTGGNMVRALLSAVGRFSPEAYLTACKRAVETGDSQRVRTMVEEAESHLSEPYPSLAGEVILHAYANDRKGIAKDLIGKCSPGADRRRTPNPTPSGRCQPGLSNCGNIGGQGHPAGRLCGGCSPYPHGTAPGVDGGTTAGARDASGARQLCRPVCLHQQRDARCCPNWCWTQGIDFDKYRAWADNKPKSAEYEAAMEALYGYVTEQKNTVQRDGPTMGGMCR